MTAQEFLERRWTIDGIIESDYAELEKLKASATRMTANFGVAVAGTKEGDKIGRAICQIQEYADTIFKDIHMQMEMRKEIFAAIKEMPVGDEQLVLRYRYINCFKFEKIAEKMKKEERTIYRIHASALEKIKIPEKYAECQ